MYTYGSGRFQLLLLLRWHFYINLIPSWSDTIDNGHIFNACCRLFSCSVDYSFRSVLYPKANRNLTVGAKHEKVAQNMCPMKIEHDGNCSFMMNTEATYARDKGWQSMIYIDLA